MFQYCPFLSILAWPACSQLRSDLEPRGCHGISWLSLRCGQRNARFGRVQSALSSPIPVEQIFAQLQEQVSKVSAFLPALDRGEGTDYNCYGGSSMDCSWEHETASPMQLKPGRRKTKTARSGHAQPCGVENLDEVRSRFQGQRPVLTGEYNIDGSNLWALLKPALNTDAGQQLFAQIFPTGFGNDNQDSAAPRFDRPHRRRGLYENGPGR